MSVPKMHPPWHLGDPQPSMLVPQKAAYTIKPGTMQLGVLHKGQCRHLASHRVMVVLVASSTSVGHPVQTFSCS